MNEQTQELMHHGILGMKWGIRRYQPYGEGGYNPQHKGKFTGKEKKATFKYLKEAYKHNAGYGNKVIEDFKNTEQYKKQQKMIKLRDKISQKEMDAEEKWFRSRSGGSIGTMRELGGLKGYRNQMERLEALKNDKKNYEKSEKYRNDMEKYKKRREELDAFEKQREKDAKEYIKQILGRHANKKVHVIFDKNAAEIAGIDQIYKEKLSKVLYKDLMSYDDWDD